MKLLNCASIERLVEQNDSITVFAGKGRLKRPVFSVSKLVELHNKPTGGKDGKGRDDLNSESIGEDTSRDRELENDLDA